MYRFLITPRWLGLAAVTITAVVIMILLGQWQLDRYRERDAINARIDATATADPVGVASVLPPPAVGGGPPPPEDRAWTRVTVTGVYDPAGEVLVRGRSVEGRVGFEVITPLRTADGSAVLVDRGWVPAAPEGPTARPDVPPVPSGEVTVVGRVRLSESGGQAVERLAGAGAQVRRIAVPHIARELPYPVYGAYVLADPVEPGFTAIPVRQENSWQNAAYVVQWWLLAGLTVVGFGYLARREALAAAGTARAGAAGDTAAVSPTGDTSPAG